MTRKKETAPRRNSHGLTTEVVKKIREDWNSLRYTLDELTDKYKVDVRRICYNKSWLDTTYVPIPRPTRK